MSLIAAYVPVPKPITPNTRIKASLIIVILVTLGQNVISSRIGGKIRAKKELPKAPTKEIIKSISGMLAASATNQQTIINNQQRK